MSPSRLRVLAYGLAINYAVYRTLLDMVGVRKVRLHVVADLL